MIASGLLKHICNEFSCDGSPALVLLVLTRIWEERYDRCNTFCTGDLARMDHNTKFHEGSIDFAAASADDVHIVLAYRLDYANVSLSEGISRNFSLGNWETNTELDK